MAILPLPCPIASPSADTMSELLERLREAMRAMYVPPNYFHMLRGAQEIPKARQGAQEIPKARQKAEQLLLSRLTREQQADYQKDGSFACLGGETKRRYGLHSRGENRGLVVCRDAPGGYTKYCIRFSLTEPMGGVYSLPIEDLLLAQKLLIENDEKGFIVTANTVYVESAHAHRGYVSTVTVDAQTR